MKISDLRIGTKLISSFVLVIIIFGAIAGYQIVRMTGLAALQDEGAQRASDAVELNDIKLGLVDLYAVMADGIINRNVEETRESFAFEKTEALQNTQRVRELVDTAEEKAWAEEFALAYQEYLDLFEEQILPILEKGESAIGRAHAALTVKEIAIRVSEVYTVMADAVINRNLEETREDFAEIKSQTRSDIGTLNELVDTEEELAWVSEFEEYSTHYLDTFEYNMLPLLAGGGSAAEISAADGEIDAARNNALEALNKINMSLGEEEAEVAADEEEIRRLDGEIDGLRAAAIAPTEKIEAALEAEQVEADTLFDATVQQTILLALIVSLFGVVIAVVLALIISRAITRPLRIMCKRATPPPRPMAMRPTAIREKRSRRMQRCCRWELLEVPVETAARRRWTGISKNIENMDLDAGGGSPACTLSIKIKDKEIERWKL